MINVKEFSFYGQITNRKHLSSVLNLPQNATDFELIQSAFLKWQSSLNLHLAGDYAIVLPLKEKQQVLICLSAFSSHQIFYKNDGKSLRISNQLSDFSTQAKVSPLSVSQLLQWRYICSPNTLFKEFYSLNNGQSIIWQIGSNPKQLIQKQLTLPQKLDAAPSEAQPTGSEHLNYGELALSNQFNQLPHLCQVLTQPISALWQIEFFLMVQKSQEDQLICKQKPQLEQVQSKFILNTNILRSCLNKEIRALNKLRDKLNAQYQAEVSTENFKHRLSFETWMYLSFELPNKWAQKRQIAQAYNKQIQFHYCDSSTLNQLLMEKLSPTETQHTHIFSFNDESIVNIFDAMQRLMHHGFEPVTNKLFHIVPPISAKLVKKHPNNPTQVEEFCCLSLTLDHLARHANWTVD